MFNFRKTLAAGLVLLALGSGNAKAIETVNCQGVDDTAAVQAAWDNADSLSGVVYLPAGDCKITHINGTAASDVIVRGDGNKTRLIVAGTGHWVDLTGSRGIAFRDLLIVDDGVNIPDTLFAWLAQDGQPIGQHLSFERVNIEAKSSICHLVAFGYKNLFMERSAWRQLHNGPSRPTADIHLSTCVARFDAQNSHGLTSTHQTVAAGPLLAWNTKLLQMDFIDDAEGVTPPTLSNNVPVISVTAGAVLHATAGSVQTMGQVGLLIWHFSEGHVWDGTAFYATNGGTHLRYLVALGGGVNGNVTFRNNLLTQVALNGAPFVFGPPVTYTGDPADKTGGAGRLRIVNSDLGAHLPANHFITLGLGLNCINISAGMDTWLADSHVDLHGQTGVFCGNVRRTAFRNPETGTLAGIIVATGATEKGIVFP